jgi:hypothetical protein
VLIWHAAPGARDLPHVLLTVYCAEAVIEVIDIGFVPELVRVTT